MFKHYEFISEPYEVVQTVGFRFSGISGTDEHQIFDLRLDIVRSPGQQFLAPRLWEVNPLGGWLQPCATVLPAELCRLTVEETIAATLEFINRKGSALPTGGEKPAKAAE